MPGSNVVNSELEMDTDIMPSVPQNASPLYIYTLFFEPKITFFVKK